LRIINKTTPRLCRAYIYTICIHLSNRFLACGALDWHYIMQSRTPSWPSKLCHFSRVTIVPGLLCTFTRPLLYTAYWQKN